MFKDKSQLVTIFILPYLDERAQGIKGEQILNANLLTCCKLHKALCGKAFTALLESPINLDYGAMSVKKKDLYYKKKKL